MTRHKRTDPVGSGAGSETQVGAGVRIILRQSRRIYATVLLRFQPLDAIPITVWVLLAPVIR
jgi:hypothetical protein